MPQASETVRDAICRLFPDCDDLVTECCLLLESRGFDVLSDGIWPPDLPHGIPFADDEKACIDYLCDEYDYALFD